MVIMPLKNLRRPDPPNPPIDLNVMLTHVPGLPSRIVKFGMEPSAFAQDHQILRHVIEASLAALFSPKEVVLGQNAPISTGLGRTQKVAWG